MPEIIGGRIWTNRQYNKEMYKQVFIDGMILIINYLKQKTWKNHENYNKKREKIAKIRLNLKKLYNIINK